MGSCKHVAKRRRSRDVEVVLYGQADSNASGCHKSLMVMMAVPQRLAEDAKTGIVVSCCEKQFYKNSWQLADAETHHTTRKINNSDRYRT